MSEFLRYLYLAESHNYVGHFGREPGTSPMLQVQRLPVRAGRGIPGDRFFDWRPDFKGQISFFANEVLEDIASRFPGQRLLPSMVRRNVITAQVDLNAWIGREFQCQGIHFFGTEECRPCHWMNVAIGPGAESAMKGRGGLRARILTDGYLREGEADWT